MKSKLDFFLLHHRVFLVKNFYQCNGDYFGVKTKYEINYKDRSDSPKFSCDVMIEVVNLFEETGSVFKPTENAIQRACEQIEQVYIKTENPEEVFEDEIEVHNPTKCFFDPSELIEENNLTHIRDITEVQNSTSDPNNSSDNHEKFPLIQEFKIEIADEEPKKLPEFCDSCQKNLKRNHTETELHGPDEELSGGSSSKCEGPKPAKIPKKNTGKKRVRGESNNTWITEEAVMQTALQEILQDRLKIREAATVFGIPKTTLYSRLKKIKTELSESQKVSLLMGLKKKEMVNKFASHQIFTMAQEENLVTHLLEFSKLNFGLTQCAIRKLAYQYAVSIDQKVPPSWETNKRAGESWPSTFLKRHRNITTRKAEALKNYRFTEKNVEMFFKNLKEIRTQHYFEPSRIFSLDETEISTVPQVSTGKSEELVKCVRIEKGETVAICAFFNAAGQSLPPVYLFPRKRYNPEYMEGCIEGSIAFYNGKGSMDEETFLKTLEHLKTQTAASKDDQILLIFNNYVASHSLSLDAMIFCKENGIHMLTLPTHMIHRTKPSDLSVFSSFDMYCASAFDAWMSSGNRVKIHNIARLSVEPLQKCMTSENIKSIFMKNGIYPMDSSKLLSFFETTETEAVSSHI